MIGTETDTGWREVLKGGVSRSEMLRVLPERMAVLEREGATVRELSATIEAMQAEFPGQPVLVACDYIQILESELREERQRVADILARLDEIARRYRVVVLAISQMSRTSSRAARNGGGPSVPIRPMAEPSPRRSSASQP
jgi:replicative DNA helicase